MFLRYETWNCALGSTGIEELIYVEQGFPINLLSIWLVVGVLSKLFQAWKLP